MRYTVTSIPAADEELAAIWADAADRDAVTRVAHEIDRLLCTDPLRFATAQGDKYWLVETPLAVYFSFSPDDCMVCILHVTVVE